MFGDVPQLTAPPATGSLVSAVSNAAPAVQGVLANLRQGNSTCMMLASDSTGDSPSEWFSLLGQKLITQYPSHNLLWRKWNDALQRYDLPSTLVAGASGQQYVSFSTGQLTYTTGAAITGDLDVRVKLRPTSWVTATAQTPVGKWTAATTSRGWIFQITPSGRLSFTWSVDGTATTGTVTSTSVAPFTNGDTAWIQVTFDVDNGASGNTTTFYTSIDGTTWTMLDSPIVTAGVTSIFNNAAIPYQVGSFSSTPTNPYFGDIFWLEVCNGIAGHSVIPPMLNYYEQTTSSVTNTVLFNGSPSLLLLCGAQSGQAIAYFNDTTRRPKIFAPHGQQLIMLSTGHNEGLLTAQTWFTTHGTWVTNIKANIPNTPILLVTQNPSTAPVTSSQIAIKTRRAAHILSYAAATAGVYGIDVAPAFTDLAGQVDADGIHPLPAGSEALARYAYTNLFR